MIVEAKTGGGSGVESGDRATPQPAVEGDLVRRLDGAERWIADIFRAGTPAGGILLVEVDMSRPAALLSLLEPGEAVTYTAVFVRACALALARHPELNVVVGATKRIQARQVDVGLSIAGESACAPVMVLEGADRTSLVELAQDIRARAAEVREKERQDLARLRRWGRLVPSSTLRTRLVRSSLRRPGFRRRTAGTFQVTTVRNADCAIPLTLVATGALAAGAVRPRVVAVDGQPAVRLMATLACAFDHKIWDGVRAATFLAEVRRILEQEDL